MSNEWIKEELKNIKEEEQAWKESQGFKDILTLERGDNRVVLNLDKKYEQVTTKYGERIVWELKNPKEKVLMLPIWVSKNLLEFISANGNNPNVVVIRSGEGKETKYEFKLWGGQ
jgi:hypothetical protein